MHRENITYARWLDLSSQITHGERRSRRGRKNRDWKSRASPDTKKADAQTNGVAKRRASDAGSMFLHISGTYLLAVLQQPLFHAVKLSEDIRRLEELRVGTAVLFRA